MVHRVHACGPAPHAVLALHLTTSGAANGERTGCSLWPNVRHIAPLRAAVLGLRLTRAKVVRLCALPRWLRLGTPAHAAARRCTSHAPFGGEGTRSGRIWVRSAGRSALEARTDRACRVKPWRVLSDMLDEDTTRCVLTNASACMHRSVGLRGSLSKSPLTVLQRRANWMQLLMPFWRQK